MAIICKISGHKWVKGLSGCRCSRCGETRTHDWRYVQNGNCEQVCGLCGETKGAHLEDAHDWDGCICKRCGKKRDKDHLFDGCKCIRCGTVSYEDRHHDWNGCVCRRCGAKRNEGHDWQYVKQDDCRQRCSKCGAERIEYRTEEFHDWNACVCKRCGAVARFDNPAHTWVTLPNCKKQCSVCGKIAYDHDFQQHGKPYTDPVDDLSHVLMRCSKCGFTYATNSESKMNAPLGWVENK